MRLDKVDGEWLGRPLPEALEPVGGDARLATAGGGVEPVGARAAEGVHASGDHLQAADVYAVDYAHAGSAQLGVQVAEDLVQGGGAAAVVPEVPHGAHGVGSHEHPCTITTRIRPQQDRKLVLQVAKHSGSSNSCLGVVKRLLVQWTPLTRSKCTLSLRTRQAILCQVVARVCTSGGKDCPVAFMSHTFSAAA